MSSSYFTLRKAAWIVWTLGWADFLLKYRGSIFGYLWSLAVPLSKFLIFLYVFRVIFPVDMPNYTLHLFIGIILWEYFVLLTCGCMSMPLEKAGIIQKVAFPRVLLILSVGWTSFIIFLTYLLVYLIFAFLAGVVPSWWSLLYIPVVLAQVSLLCLGIGMILSSYALRYRDLSHLWNILLQLLFWLTPITYAHAVYSPVSLDAFRVLSNPALLSGWGALQIFTRFQPLSLLLFDVRRILFSSDISGMPSLVHVTALMIFCGMVFFLGMFIFERRSRYFIQEY